jgi:hypothetical protein
LLCAAKTNKQEKRSKETRNSELGSEGLIDLTHVCLELTSALNPNHWSKNLTVCGSLISDKQNLKPLHLINFDICNISQTLQKQPMQRNRFLWAVSWTNLKYQVSA